MAIAIEQCFQLSQSKHQTSFMVNPSSFICTRDQATICLQRLPQLTVMISNIWSRHRWHIKRFCPEANIKPKGTPILKGVPARRSPRAPPWRRRDRTALGQGCPSKRPPKTRRPRRPRRPILKEPPSSHETSKEARGKRQEQNRTGTRMTMRMRWQRYTRKREGEKSRGGGGGTDDKSFHHASTMEHGTPGRERVRGEAVNGN